MLGNIISNYRKKLGLTQEQLAQKLEVTNQAVSKWETDQCCPDVLLLPKLAEVLGISLDTLFGREERMEESKVLHDLPWEDDGAFHIVVYCGHKLLGSSKAGPDCTFTYEGPVRDIYCELNLECGDVQGSINAGGSVETGNVGGGVSAGDYVECGNVEGNVAAGDYVECGNVDGGVTAGNYVECGNVGGSVFAGGDVECGLVGRNVESESSGPQDDGKEGPVIVIERGGNKKKFDFRDFWKNI